MPCHGKEYPALGLPECPAGRRTVRRTTTCLIPRSKRRSMRNTNARTALFLRTRPRRLAVAGTSTYRPIFLALLDVPAATDDLLSGPRLAPLANVVVTPWH